MATSPEDIDNILPQTQCGLCGYGGCMPYAEALVYEKAAIDLCPPGGVKTLLKIAELTQQDASPYIDAMEKKTKPLMTAFIREAECIGCVKCIAACPVDAIVGSTKVLHTVLTDLCTGCELCVPACPVDCIDMLPAAKNEISESDALAARSRFMARQVRLDKEKKESPLVEKNILKRKSYIQDAIARAKAKKALGSK